MQIKEITINFHFFYGLILLSSPISHLNPSSIPYSLNAHDALFNYLIIIIIINLRNMPRTISNIT